MPVCPGRSPLGVSIYQECSVSSGTSNYRPPMGKRDRPKAETGTGLSGNISYVRRHHASVSRASPDRSGHFPGRLCYV